jgi:hypothetical protein
MQPNKVKSAEEMIEFLKAQFPSVKFRAGSVGFAMEIEPNRIIFPYSVFMDPNFGNVMEMSVTQLETMGPSPDIELPKF